MIEAYVLIVTATKKWKSAADRIRDLESVKRARRVTGDYDVVALAEAEDMSTLTDSVIEKIRNVDGVTETTTAIVVG